ncbi:NfeD family protein [Leptolyngbya sp. PCC 6406]|uniref:NfeD family protein n=1 Tax=Leptolyngbya sp. PCC 6406 TaxID=1173264 RepID=UPI0002ACBAFB|nr:NfeD family protein [Leptolyngbya sp. PCC 6406]
MTLPDLLSLTVGPIPWLVWGLGLLGLSLLLPEPTIVSLGCASLVTSLVALTLTGLPQQLLVWGILSSAFILIFRGLVPRQSKALAPARYAQVREMIPAAGVGRVFYEGGLWQARCQISDVAISPEETVSVVGRQGNVLLVTPLPTAESQAQ